MTEAIRTLAKRQVNRKEFMMIIGLGLLSVIGIGSIVKFVTDTHPNARLKQYLGEEETKNYGGRV